MLNTYSFAKGELKARRRRRVQRVACASRLLCASKGRIFNAMERRVLFENAEL
jgi:hypothetical protein